MIVGPKGAVGRLAHLLKLIGDGPTTFTLTDLVDRSDLPTSTVHRLLQELVRSNLVERSASRAYRPGRELYLLASRLVARFDLVACVRPFLEELGSKWQETAVLCTFSPSAQNAVISDLVLTRHPLRYAIETGDVLELPWGSLGRAILANLPEERRVAILRADKIGPISGRALAPFAEMEEALAEIRAQGHARHCDLENDLAGVASPIFGRGNVVIGCLGITMPARRFSLHSEEELSRSVRNAAVAVSESAQISRS